MNTSDGIKLFIQGENSDINLFINSLKTSPPALSKIESMVIDDIKPDNTLDDFKILNSIKENNNLIKNYNRRKYEIYKRTNKKNICSI